MPGFDRTGPMGMGPMTGGARGRCTPYGRSFAGTGFGPWFGRGRGRGRGRHRMYSASGAPGSMRFGPTGSWGPQFGAPYYTREQEVESLRDQAVALKGELEAIDGRLRDLESEGKSAD